MLWEPMAGFVVHPGAVTPYERLRSHPTYPARHLAPAASSEGPSTSKQASATRSKQPSAARYYAALARSAPWVLEYGAGRGTISWSMAAAGARVVAVDLSGLLLADLVAQGRTLPREVARRISVRQADARTLRLRRRFPLVVAPENTLAHFYSRRDLEAFFAGVRHHLAPGGRFVFDVALPRFAELTEGYDPLAQVRHRDVEEGVTLAERQFHPRELEMLLHYNGFSGLRMRGDFTRRRPDAGTQVLVVEARADRGRPERSRKPTENRAC